jgi:hypothetical protein
VVKAAEPTWTPACWERALAELEQWHLLQQLANAQQQWAQARAWGNDQVRIDTDEAGAACDDDREP